MVDQNELIEQYRTTLEVMKEKLSNLREEKERQNQELMYKKSVNEEFKALEADSEMLQEEIQALNLEIFKEKGNLRKLKADNEWDDEKLQNSAEIIALNQELEECLKRNHDLKSKQNDLNGESKLAQLEHVNPKLFALIKKIINAEESNVLLKEEIAFLDQERNKIRGEYHKITQYLGQEEKIKIKIREIEKEVERSEFNIMYLKTRINDSILDLEKEKEILAKSESKNLLERLDDLRLKKVESEEKIAEATEMLNHLEAEIESEKKCENKAPPTNLKQEIKNLEAEITEKNKEIKLKQAEKRKILMQLDQKVKEINSHKRSKARSNETNSPSKMTMSKSSANFSIPESGKRDVIVNLVGRSIAEGKPSDIKHVLRHVGSQGQGLATKLVQLNRDEFLKKIKFAS